MKKMVKEDDIVLKGGMQYFKTWNKLSMSSFWKERECL